jgi:hypothetical protein
MTLGCHQRPPSSEVLDIGLHRNTAECNQVSECQQIVDRSANNNKPAYFKDRDVGNRRPRWRWTRHSAIQLQNPRSQIRYNLDYDSSLSLNISSNGYEQ